MYTTKTRARIPAHRPIRRSRLFAVLFVLMAMMLTACGADVNSRLDLKSDYSGQRIFVLTMADNDVSALSGGVEAADQAFETHAPEVLTYEGVETEEDGYSATFTMPFEDLEEYERNITLLLDASEVPASEREMTIEVEEQALTTSVVFEEDFYNDDLMGWAADALIEEEVVAESTTVFTSSGSATVTFAGEDVETSTSLPRINFTATADHRFDEVGLDFEILESEDIRIAMSYLITPEDQQMQNDYLSEQVSQLQDVDGLDGEVEDSGPVHPDDASGQSRDIAATFTSAQAVTEGIQLLLGNDDASFEVLEQTGQGSPDVTVQYVGTDWTCEEICDPNNLQQLSGETIYPKQWELAEERRADGELLLEFNRGMPLDSLTSSTQLNYTGGMNQTFEFVVDNQMQEGHEEVIEERFAPPEGLGSFDATSQESTTVYTVSFEADNADELTTVLKDYLASKDVEDQIALKHDPLTGLWASYDLQADLSAVWELATGGVEGAAIFEVTLPVMHSGESATGAETGRTVVIDEPSGTFTVTASGPTVTTIWVAVLVIAVLTAAIILLILSRKASSRTVTSTKHDEDPRPYNVQGPRDDLTETQILASPVATHPSPSDTTKLTEGSAPVEDIDSEQTGPFPDIPTPSHGEYHQWRDRLDAPQESTEQQAGDTSDQSREQRSDSTDRRDDS